MGEHHIEGMIGKREPGGRRGDEIDVHDLATLGETAGRFQVFAGNIRRRHAGGENRFGDAGCDRGRTATRVEHVEAGLQEGREEKAVALQIARRHEGGGVRGMSRRGAFFGWIHGFVCCQTRDRETVK